MLALVLLCAQADVLVEDFDGEVVRDAIYDGWERVSDATHPLYNAVRVERGRVRLRTLRGGATLRHRGVPVDPRLVYRLTVTIDARVRANTADASLRWLRQDVELRVDAGSLPLTVEEPPPDADAVQVELRLGGPDVESEATFDGVRLSAWPRIEVRRPGRPLPVFARDERIVLETRAPARPGARIETRLLDESGAPVREPLAPGLYRVEARMGEVTRRVDILVTGEPRVEGPVGIFVRTGDPVAAADAAGVRHVAVDDPALVTALARRPGTSIAFLGAIPAPLRSQIDRAITRDAIVAAPERAVDRVYVPFSLRNAALVRRLNARPR